MIRNQTFNSRRLCLCLVFILNAAIGACAQDVITSKLKHLVGYWPLNDGQGTTLDELSGKSQPGMLRGNADWIADGDMKVLDFKRANRGRVQINSSSSWDSAPGIQKDLTISFWVNAKKPGFVVNHYFGGIPAAWGFFHEGNRLIFSVYHDREDWKKERSSKVAFKGTRFNRWHFVSLVWKRGKKGWLKSYVDGKFVMEDTFVPVTASLIKNLIVGFSGNRGFDGQVKELSIFDTTLNDKEIQSLYKKGIRIPQPVIISFLQPEKIYYHPDDKAKIALRLRNMRDEAQQVELELDLIHKLFDKNSIAKRSIKLKPRENVTLHFDADVSRVHYGCEVRAKLKQAGKLVATKSDYFQVAERFTDVIISAGGFGSALHTGKNEACLEVPGTVRNLYANSFEYFFVSPCDWAQHASPLETWWSGQASYPQKRINLKRSIANARKQGIVVSLYANSNPSGPFAWEIARQRPEWFLNAQGKLPSLPEKLVEVMHHWNDPAWRKTRQGNPGGWVVLPVDLRRVDALDYGIDAIIAGAKDFGFEMVRFDGHYTIRGHDEISTRNMRRLKERVNKTYPRFCFGYNYGRSPHWRAGVTREMREGMAGGGLFLQEGIRAWWEANTKYTKWSEYYKNELQHAKLVKSMGGSYQCMWESGHEKTEAKRYYKFAFGLIAGGHPGTYEGKEPFCPNWGRFLNRWSGFLWDIRLKPSKIKGIEVKAPSRVIWKELLQERVISKNRKYTVIHLVNPPTSDEIAKSEVPTPIKNVRLDFNVARGERIVNAMLVDHARMPHESKVPFGKSKVSLTIPELKYWNMCIVETRGDYRPIPAPPKYTKRPDAAAVKKSMNSVITTRIFDPNKDDVAINEAEAGSDTRVWETDGGFSGVPAVSVSDELAGNKIAQLRTTDLISKGGSQRFMGRTWIGALPAGKYECVYRVRWTQEKEEEAFDLMMYVTDVQANKDYKTYYATPNIWENIDAHTGTGIYRGDPPGRFKKMKAAGKYHDYKLRFEKKASGYINACIIVGMNKKGGQKLYLDHIKTRLIEAFDDEKQLAILNQNKSDDLESEADMEISEDDMLIPNGKKPKKILLVKGMYSEAYQIEKQVKCDSVFTLPKEKKKLFVYDALVLANYDLVFTELSQRLLVRDFVKAGGRLVVLGGHATFGNGAFKHTFFDELMPFDVSKDKGIIQHAPPLKFKNLGNLHWTHDMPVNPKVTVLAKAGPLPVAAMHQVGDGYVYAFSGTVLGKDKLFTLHPGWKKHLTTWIQAQPGRREQR